MNLNKRLRSSQKSTIGGGSRVAALSKHQRKRDIAEAITARREAADTLNDAMAIFEKVQNKLSYNKSNAELQQLKNMSVDLKELVDVLRDPENDPIE